MATAHNDTIPTEMSSISNEPNAAPEPQTSSDSVGNQNRLIQYVRSLPLVSLLFGRNAPPGTLPNEPNRSFIFKCLMVLHLVILVTLVGLTTFAIYHYNIRFYKSQTRPSETLIVCWLLRAMWHTINSSWALRYYVSNINHRPNLKLSQAFYNMASILWISLTVVFLGISPREDLKSTSAKICYFLLWITIASYVVPMLAYTVICILLYATLLIVVFFRHGSISLSSFGVPSQLLKKLKVERYKDVLKKIEMSNLDSGNLDGPEIKDDSFSVLVLPEDHTATGRKDSRIESQTTLYSREGFTDCVNNDDMLNDRMCSICILTIKDEDKVYLLPCDIRHLFHRDCLNKWFKRSSECPICRTNISDLLSDKKEPVQEPLCTEPVVNTNTNTQNEFSESMMIDIVIDDGDDDAYQDLRELEIELEYEVPRGNISDLHNTDITYEINEANREKALSDNRNKNTSNIINNIINSSENESNRDEDNNKDNNEQNHANTENNNNNFNKSKEENKDKENENNTHELLDVSQYLTGEFFKNIYKSQEVSNTQIDSELDLELGSCSRSESSENSSSSIESPPQSINEDKTLNTKKP